MTSSRPNRPCSRWNQSSAGSRRTWKASCRTLGLPVQAAAPRRGQGLEADAMPSPSPSTDKYLDALPEWARELSEKYYSRSYALFVLCGNVRDLIPFRQPSGIDFVSLDSFLSHALFGQRDLVLHYDRGGLSFGSPDSQ